mgnify:CR=1 FL=1
MGGDWRPGGRPRRSSKLPLPQRVIVLDRRLRLDVQRERIGMDRRHHGHSITLTPGTVTVSIDDKPMLLHCLTKDGEDDLLEGDMERHVKRLYC